MFTIYAMYDKMHYTNVHYAFAGEGFRSIRVSELGTPCGTIQIALNYRTVMTLSPSKKPKTESIMVKSDHFPYDSPK